MGITELHDAIAIESCRQIRRGILYILHAELLETKQETIACQNPYNYSTRNNSLSPNPARQCVSEQQRQYQWNHNENHQHEEGYGEAGNHF